MNYVYFTVNEYASILTAVVQLIDRTEEKLDNYDPDSKAVANEMLNDCRAIYKKITGENYE